MGGGIREQNERARECGRCDRILHALLSNTGECIYGKEEIHAAETHEWLRVGMDPKVFRPPFPGKRAAAAKMVAAVNDPSFFPLREERSNPNPRTKQMVAYATSFFRPFPLWGILRVERLTRRGVNGASFSNKDGSAFWSATKP